MSTNGICPEGRWITADLHIHSVYSGGGLTPREILAAAQRKFLDAVAITDHAMVAGALEARELAARLPAFPVGLPAQEISAGDHFHFLLIGCDERLSGLNRQNLAAQIAAEQQKGGVVILAHPWTIARNQWARDCVAELIGSGLLSGMEFFNAGLLEMREDPERITQVFTAFWEEWVKPHRLGVTGGSDLHHPFQSWRLGSGRTYLKVKQCNEMGILEALREKRYVAGLISERIIPFPWAQGNNCVLWGNEPWLGDLQQIVAAVHHFVTTESDDAALTRFLASLMAAGHYQKAYDVITGNSSLPTVGSLTD